MKFIPFDQVKEAVSIEQVMDRTGLAFKKQGQSYRCECPVHKGGKRSLIVSPNEKDQKGEDGVFYCHASGEGGDRIGLLAHVNKTGQYAAVKELAEAFCPQLVGGKDKASQPASKEATVPEKEKEEERSGKRGFSPLPYLESNHEAVREAGLSPEVAEALGIGFAPRGVHRGRIAIPVRLSNGSIAGYLSVDGGVNRSLISIVRRRGRTKARTQLWRTAIRRKPSGRV